MYPFGTSNLSPENRWYIAAYSSEITIKPIERKFLIFRWRFIELKLEVS